MITIASIKAAVAEHYGVSKAAMESASRERAVAHPRQVAMYLARQLGPGKSLHQIGSRFGRDHTTVMHAEQKIGRLVTTDAELRRDLIEICRALTAPPEYG